MLWTWLTSVALAAPCPPTDVGAARTQAPAVLLIQTPGVSAAAYDGWVHTIEQRGLDAWLLSCPAAHQDADTILAAIPEALAGLSGRPVALAGHSLGGTLAAMAVADGLARPDALGLIGAPLRGDPTALDDWLAHRPLPDAPAPLGALLEATWRGQVVGALLVGDPLPPLEPVSPAWLSTVRAWGHGALRIDLQQTDVPVWALASGMDNIAPPERVRALVPAGSFLRYGYLSLDGPDPDHADLLLDSRPITQLSRWLKDQL